MAATADVVRPKPKFAVCPHVSLLDDADGMGKLADFCKQEGYCVFRGLVASSDDLSTLRDSYERILAMKTDYRCDLGASEDRKSDKVENITQVMWPSLVDATLAPGSDIHEKALLLAQKLLGEDMSFDFDMMINKMTDTPTPFHVDAAYWPDTPDPRALSFWVPLDPVDVDRGCMWYGPRTHTIPLRKHRSSTTGAGALMCDGTEEECVPVPMEPGDVGIHSGRTLHYSRGNKTGKPRRAYIMNFRPKAMVEYFRARGFDHGRAGNASGNHTVVNDEASKGGEASVSKGGASEEKKTAAEETKEDAGDT